MSKIKSVLKKLDNFIEELITIKQNIEDTNIITDEMKILFHYIDEYNEIKEDAGDMFGSDDTFFSPYDTNSIDSGDMYCSDFDPNIDGNVDNTDDSTSGYVSDDNSIDGDKDYTAKIMSVMGNSDACYANYMNVKMLIKKNSNNSDQKLEEQ